MGPPDFAPSVSFHNIVRTFPNFFAAFFSGMRLTLPGMLFLSDKSATFRMTKILIPQSLADLQGCHLEPFLLYREGLIVSTEAEDLELILVQIYFESKRHISGHGVLLDPVFTTYPL